MQVHPQEYQADLQAILGFVLKHDDSVNDRSDGSKLNNADENTRKLWFEVMLASDWSVVPILSSDWSAISLLASDW